MQRGRAISLLALALALALPASAAAKHHHGKPVAVEAEFSFTGLTEFKQDTNGTSLTCPDSSEPYKFEDHVRAHIAWDTVWRVRIPLNPGREQRVIESKHQKLRGSTWSIRGKALSDEECVPPKSYSCSGTFRPAGPASMVFTPIEDDRWLALMNGPGGLASKPSTCSYAGVHRHILGELPDETLERATGGFDFKPHRLLEIRHKTVTGDFNYDAVDSDCGSDDMVTCKQSLEGSGAIRYHRLRIVRRH